MSGRRDRREPRSRAGDLPGGDRGRRSRRPWLGCGARCAAPSPSGCCCSASTPPRSASTRSARRSTRATSPTTCWPRSRSSTTATSTCWTSTRPARTRTSTPTSSTGTGAETEGRLNEPHGVGFPLLIAPAYAIAGATARRAVPRRDRGPGGGAGLPARAARGARPVGARRRAGRRPQPAAPRVRHRRLPRAGRGARRWPAPRCSRCGSTSASRAATPSAASCCWARCPGSGRSSCRPAWWSALFAARPLWRSRRRTLAIGAVELSLFSVALYVAINEALYGGPTPYAADVEGETATGASFPGGYLGRALPAGGAVHRPRVRAPALGAGVRARVRRPVVAVARASRPRHAGRARRARASSSRRACARPCSERSCWWRPS